jgi:hypothetical protein
MHRPQMPPSPVTLEEANLRLRTAYCRESHDDLTPEQVARQLAPSPSPSSGMLPYFEYRGPGSVWALTICGTCGMGKTLHYDSSRSGFSSCGAFVEQGPAEFDSFYCGHNGLG